ncbi:hypothetical protein B0H19DRAFT_1299488 [Mycena capillaripes]|nr:hypothetical protein B0H19DRAFT_1299488 [Mycena capillaripes]
MEPKPRSWEMSTITKIFRPPEATFQTPFAWDQHPFCIRNGGEIPGKKLQMLSDCFGHSALVSDPSRPTAVAPVSPEAPTRVYEPAPRPRLAPRPRGQSDAKWARADIRAHALHTRATPARVFQRPSAPVSRSGIDEGRLRGWGLVFKFQLFQLQVVYPLTFCASLGCVDFPQRHFLSQIERAPSPSLHCALGRIFGWPSGGRSEIFGQIFGHWHQSGRPTFSGHSNGQKNGQPPASFGLRYVLRHPYPNFWTVSTAASRDTWPYCTCTLSKDLTDLLKGRLAQNYDAMDIAFSLMAVILLQYNRINTLSLTELQEATKVSPEILGQVLALLVREKVLINEEKDQYDFNSGESLLVWDANNEEWRADHRTQASSAGESQSANQGGCEGRVEDVLKAVLGVYSMFVSFLIPSSPHPPPSSHSHWLPLCLAARLNTDILHTARPNADAPPPVESAQDDEELATHSRGHLAHFAAVRAQDP